MFLHSKKDYFRLFYFIIVSLQTNAKCQLSHLLVQKTHNSVHVPICIIFNVGITEHTELTLSSEKFGESYH